MTGFVSIREFMAHLEKEGFVIVKATELAETHALQLDLKHRSWLKQKSMTVKQASEILGWSKCKLLRMTNDPKKITKDETFMNGRTRHIMTITVKRLRGYE